ncbi:MAG: CRISPR-associated protein Cas4, partial [bacterium]
MAANTDADAANSAESTNSHPSSGASSPDYLPARMLNEFVYCPRLFYYEWVEGVFAHNRETTEGSLRHAKLDAKSDALPAAEELGEEDKLHSRSVMLSSDEHGLVAKMDLIEGDGEAVCPVDYKRGSPRKDEDGALELWDTDRAQLAAQAIILRDNGYACDEAVVYYVSTKQRVRLPIDETLIAETLDHLAAARRTAESDHIPPPLIDSPKCPRCSLVGICLPDETSACRGLPARTVSRKQLTLFETDEPPDASAEVSPRKEDLRRLLPARADLRPLYLNTQGLRVGVSGGVLKVKEKNKVVQEVRIGEICQLNLLGNVQLTTQAVQTLCRQEVPVAYFSQGGWFYGTTQGMGLKNVFLRKDQF